MQNNSLLVKGIIKNIKEHPEDWIGRYLDSPFYGYSFSHSITRCNISLRGGVISINDENYGQLKELKDVLDLIPGTALFDSRIKESAKEISRLYFEPLGCPDNDPPTQKYLYTGVFEAIQWDGKSQTLDMIRKARSEFSFNRFDQVNADLIDFTVGFYPTQEEEIKRCTIPCGYYLVFEDGFYRGSFSPEDFNKKYKKL